MSCDACGKRKFKEWRDIFPIMTNLYDWACAARCCWECRNVLKYNRQPALKIDFPCSGSVVADPESGLAAAQVGCHGKIKSLFLPIGAFVDIDITARSLKEGR